MNILSLFDGISCGQQAIERVGIKKNNYFASEIDKHAIKVTMQNYPDTIQLGSVTELDTTTLPQIDLLIGGSPCQSFSFAGKMKGMATKDNVEILTLEHYLQLKNDGFEFEGQSYLFWEYVRVLKQVNPKYFLLENVKMSKKWKDLISETLGIEPIEINSRIFSAQNRPRLYWTNIPIDELPVDKGIVIKDILDKKVDKKYLPGSDLLRNYCGGNQLNPNYKSQANTIYNINGKSNTICAGTHGYAIGYIDINGSIRKYTPTECERLQTLNPDYTKVDGVSDTQRYKMIGNGWTVDVIAHILKNIK
jgi:DNA-cytosine methyltransferase